MRRYLWIHIKYFFSSLLSPAPTLKGDMIYADNAIEPSKNVTNGKGGEYISTWTNNPSKNFVAVTLDEFRANWKYNFGDDKMQSFLSKTPIYNQWDDHEVSAIRSTWTFSILSMCELNLLTNLLLLMLSYCPHASNDHRWQITGGPVR